jgi:hypothetical protein
MRRALAAVCAMTVVLGGCKFEFMTPDKEIKAVFQQNIAGMNEESADLTMGTVHPKSQSYEQMQVLLEEIWKQYDLKTTMTGFQYIGSYGKDYAIAWTEQKSEKVEGPEFRDNFVSAFTIFRMSEGSWKIWQ